MYFCCLFEFLCIFFYVHRYFRANVKIDNVDGTALKDVRRKMAKAEEKIATLKLDKLTLTTKLNLLRERTATGRNISSFYSTSNDYAEGNEMSTAETFSDSSHAYSDTQSERL